MHIYSIKLKQLKFCKNHPLARQSSETDENRIDIKAPQLRKKEQKVMLLTCE